jgi:hypothetical protein
MQWSDVTAPPPTKTLRQFAGLCLVVFPALALWRVWRGQPDAIAAAIAAAGLLIGILGLIRPAAIRLVFTGWMVVAFPMGWTLSRIALGLMFYGLITPIAFVFRLMGRDVLHRRRPSGASYWSTKARPADVREYFRQF